MDISRQSPRTPAAPERGPRARTRRLLVETASRLMQEGHTPSVSEAAEAAGVSRATAYRYFPSQAALIQVVVDEGLGPILTWRPPGGDPGRRVADLFATALPRLEAYESTFRAALKLSLDQWARRQAGTLGDEPRFTRGHRVDLLRQAVAPLRGELPPASVERLAQALSLVFGVEALIVLKDMWGLDGEAVRAVAQWAASALVEATLQELPGRSAERTLIETG